MQDSAPLTSPKLSLIKNWAKDDRPREKLILKGPDALTESELLCLLLGRNTPGKGVMDLARDILHNCQESLQVLGKYTVKDLTKLKLEGFGKAKACAVVAAFELGRRRQADPLPEKLIFKDTKVAARYLQSLLAHKPQEEFAILYLDQGNGLVHHEIISKGGITATYVDPRLIFKNALREGAVSIIVSHNHPSGNLRPSQADRVLTDRIKEGANYLDIKLLDHIIVSPSGYFTFAGEGLL